MPKRTNAFQQLVFMLRETLARKGVSVAQSAELPDSDTGELREVDIVLTSDVGGTRVIVSIEVTDRTRMADTPWVESMLQKHSTLPTSKLVLVSRSGFTGTAEEKARRHKADTLTVAEANRVDWPAALTLLGGGVFELIEMHFTCSAIIGDDARSGPIGLRTRVTLPYRDEPTDIEAMVRYFLAEPSIRAELDKHLTVGHKTFGLEYASQSGTRLQDGRAMKRLDIALSVDVSRTPMQFSIGHIDCTDFVLGTPADKTGRLTVAMFRSNDGHVLGRLLNAGSVRALNVSPDLHS
jgi:hypothetical protein